MNFLSGTNIKPSRTVVFTYLATIAAAALGPRLASCCADAIPLEFGTPEAFALGLSAFVIELGYRKARQHLPWFAKFDPWYNETSDR